MEIRSFLAFELPGEIKDTVARVSDVAKRTRMDVRWIDVDNIHLTVLFMGNIREADFSDIRTSIE
ncbi:MAG: hypothetical protein JRJ23_03990, partial [Deltaproteobacteria bacterium]|nr:hypothetical protein [Deltaproteobacteria bacterium]